jgi:NAD(P)-dependent dehydrogenase (short-subunit alcohol dehydrogenase family)
VNRGLRAERLPPGYPIGPLRGRVGVDPWLPGLRAERSLELNLLDSAVMSSGKRSVPEVVVVTGGSAGVGRAVVRRFAVDGARIGILARGEEGLDATRREVENLGGTPLTISVDVSDHEAVESAAQRVEEELGAIDIWINNAMTSVFSPIMKITPEEFRRVTDVTYLGYVWGTMAALRRMVPRNHGKIVQVGSALGYRGIPLQAPYCGAKHAIQGFNDALYSELLHERSRISVTQVNLPAVNTPQFGWVRSRLPNRARPVPPIFQPEVIAEAIHWAAHNTRREITLGFSSMKAIWGSKLAPSIADRYLAKTGYDAQQTDEPEDPDRPDNLFEPVPGDRGAHGSFDETAKTLIPSVVLNENRHLLLAGVGLLALLVLLRKK